jgi:hypothetical protein
MINWGLHIRLFPTVTVGMSKRFLAELIKKHAIYNIVVLVRSFEVDRWWPQSYGFQYSAIQFESYNGRFKLKEQESSILIKRPVSDQQRASQERTKLRTHQQSLS